MDPKHVRSLLVMCLALSAAPTAAAQETLRLRPGDAIRIEFRDEPMLNGTFGVDQSGMVMVPILGLLRATARPFDTVRDEILSGYADELVDPEVRVIPLQRIAVLGEVRRPGLFPVDPTHTLSDVLAEAGGLTPDGRSDRILLVREGQVINGRLDPHSTTLNAAISSGDQIIVQRRSWLSKNTPFVLGAFSSVVAAAVASVLVR